MTKAEAAMTALKMTDQSRAHVVEPTPPLLRLIAELEDRLAMLSTWTGGNESPIITTIEATSGRHCALQDVLQYVVEVGDRKKWNADEAVNPDAVIDWRIGVKSALERSFAALVRAAAGTLQ